MYNIRLPANYIEQIKKIAIEPKKSFLPYSVGDKIKHPSGGSTVGMVLAIDSKSIEIKWPAQSPIVYTKDDWEKMSSELI